MRSSCDEFEELQREADAHRQRRRKAGRRMRWPAQFRQQVVGLMIGGLAAHELSRALGINRSLLGTWRRQSAGNPAARADFSEVSVVTKRRREAGGRSPSSDAGFIVLTCPGGAVISGLAFHHISTLLQAGLL